MVTLQLRFSRSQILILPFRESSVHKPSDQKPHKPGVAVDGSEDNRAALEQSCGGQEARNVGHNACCQSHQCCNVVAVGVPIQPLLVTREESVGVQSAVAQSEVVHQHDPAHGSQQRRVSDQPRGDEPLARLNQAPGLQDDADDGREQAPGPEGEDAGAQVHQSVRWRYHIRCNVGGQGGKDDPHQGQEDGEEAVDARQQLDWIRNRLPEDHHCCRCDCQAHECESGHENREAYRLACQLVHLALGVPSEICPDTSRSLNPFLHIHNY